MARADIKLVYDGDALRDGRMDVKDLAPALLAFGELFEAANSVLNGEAARVHVHVRATNTGSFEVLLEVAQSLPEQIGAFLGVTDVTQAKDLTDLIINLGTIGGVAGGGLLWLILKFKGQRPDRVEKRDDGTVRLTVDGVTVEIPVKLFNLYRNLQVRRAARKVVAPLQRPGIDELRASASDAEDPPLVIGRDDVPAFDEPEVAEEPLVDETYQAAFTIVALAFKEDNKWRLFDGNTTISAAIEDHDFLSQVDNNSVSFAKGDVLICRVRMVQTNGKSGLRTDHIVEKVIEHRSAARQLRLF